MFTLTFKRKYKLDRFHQGLYRNFYTCDVAFVYKIIHFQPCIRILKVWKLQKKVAINNDLSRYPNSFFYVITGLISSVEVSVKTSAAVEFDPFLQKSNLTLALYFWLIETSKKCYSKWIVQKLEVMYLKLQVWYFSSKCWGFQRQFLYFRGDFVRKINYLDLFTGILVVPEVLNMRFSLNHPDIQIFFFGIHRLNVFRQGVNRML